MKVRSVTFNNRRRMLEFVTFSGAVYPLPFSCLDPKPSAANKMVHAYVDPELGREAVTFSLESGEEGSVHLDQALDHNRDPAYLADVLTHKLTIEARVCADRSGLSRREIARLLHTSVPQLYRLLDPSNTSKSLAQLIALLEVVGCEVDIVIKPRDAA